MGAVLLNHVGTSEILSIGIHSAEQIGKHQKVCMLK